MERNAESIKSRLLNEIRLSVRDLQDIAASQAIPLKNCERVDRFLFVLEAVFLHELKDYQSNRGFWALVKAIAPRGELEQLRHLDLLRNDAARSRAWLRASLTDSLLESYLNAIASDARIAENHYRRSALLRDAEQLELVVPLVAGLSEVRFALALNSSLLNSWPAESLALAGLVDAPLPSPRPSPAPAANPSAAAAAPHEQTPLFAAAASASNRSSALGSAFGELPEEEVLVAEAVEVEVSEKPPGLTGPVAMASSHAERIPSGLQIVPSPQATPSPIACNPQAVSPAASIAKIPSRATLLSAASSQPLWLVYEQEECGLLPTELHELPRVASSSTTGSSADASLSVLSVCVLVFGGHQNLSSRRLSFPHVQRPRAESSNPSLLEQSGESDLPLRVECVFVAHSSALHLAREAAADESLEEKLQSPSAHVPDSRQPLVPIEEAALSPAVASVNLTQSLAIADDTAPSQSHTTEPEARRDESTEPVQIPQLPHNARVEEESGVDSVDPPELTPPSRRHNSRQPSQGTDESYAALIRSYRSFSNSITDFTAPAIEQLLAGDESRPLRERSASTNEAVGERAVFTRPTSAHQPTSPTSNSLAHQQSVPVADAVPLPPPPPPPPPTRERLESDARSVSPAISVAIAVDSDYSPGAETAHNEFFSGEEKKDSTDRSASACSPPDASAQRSGDDFEDIVPRSDADDSQPIAPSEELRMRALLTLLPGESGLDAQSFRCSRCNAPLEIHTDGSIRLYRVDFFDGAYYCIQCHRNELAVIPSRIFNNWDFSKYPVSRISKKFLDSMFQQPCLEFTVAHYELISPLKRSLELRTQLFYLSKYLLTCKRSIASELLARFRNRTYLFESLHTYSIQDLILLTRRRLLGWMRQQVHFGLRHVQHCPLCSARGFICELCQRPQLIYPYQTRETEACDRCRSLFHKACRLQQRLAQSASPECPRCARREQSAAALRRPSRESSRSQSLSALEFSLPPLSTSINGPGDELLPLSALSPSHSPNGSLPEPLRLTGANDPSTASHSSDIDDASSPFDFVF